MQTMSEKSLNFRQSGQNQNSNSAMGDTLFSEENSAQWNQCLSLSKVLQVQAEQIESSGEWPQLSLTACRQAGVFRWFIPRQFGGWEWSDLQVTDGYLLLSHSCLTTAFIVTQWHAACRRIISSPNHSLRDRLVPKLVSGELFATVGISHLTTSRQHLTQPAVRAVPVESGFRLEGSSPWITGAEAADVLVLGATLDDSSQILVAVPRNRRGVAIRPCLPLVALSASRTGPVDLEGVIVNHEEVLVGPMENVMQIPSSGGGSAGGLHTSILAIGLAWRAIQYMSEQAQSRPSLAPISSKLESDLFQLRKLLSQVSLGESTCSVSQLRRQANNLVLRATQAALQTAKGAGFVAGHPAGRWAREALFFLVWSCPQPVVEANLCDLAGLDAHL